jgi:hypothetical protein
MITLGLILQPATHLRVATHLHVAGHRLEDAVLGDKATPPVS